MPDDVAVRVGEVIRLQCLAHGTPPLSYIWSKLDGALPARAQVSDGDLQINLATAEDAGSYKCVASNSVGHSEVVAKVTVRCKFDINFDYLLQRSLNSEAYSILFGGDSRKMIWHPKKKMS